MLIVRCARVPAALLPARLAGAPVDPIEPTVLCDLAIEGSRIKAVAHAGGLGPHSSAQEFDAGGSLVFPGFIDAHVHLDKTHTWHRAPNRSHTFIGALQALSDDKSHWSEADLQRRAGFALRSAWAHGTRVIRTHVDTSTQWGERSHSVMAGLRREWAGRITLQTVPLCGGNDYLTADGEKMADLALRHGASALGGAIVGGVLGGLISGNATGAAAGAVLGGATGAIAGATAASQPGYYWAQGVCYYRYPNGQYVQADPRACY